MTEQSRAVSKALKEIQGALDLTDEQIRYLRTYLDCIYSLGMREARTNEVSRKPVQQLYRGIIIDYFDSETQAAQRTGYSLTTISRLLKTGKKSRKGYQFMYL